MRKKSELVLVLLILTTAGAAWAAESRQGSSSRPFQPGEDLSYEIRLLGILAAEADLEVGGVGPEKLRIQATARTVGPSDSVFKMRSQASCTMEADLEPSLCRSTSESRGKVKRREVRFQKEEGVVVERKMERGKVDRNELDLEPGLNGMQDALSGLYMIRANLPSVGGEPLRFRSIVKGKEAMVEARTIETTTIETELGTFPAAVVEVKVLGKQDKDTATHARLWISMDENRLPLRATTKITLGSMEATLVRAEGTKSGKLAQR